MHREIIIESVISQVFNDQYERPDLDFIAQMNITVLRRMTDVVFNKFALLVLAEEPNANSVIAAMGTTAGAVSGYRSPSMCAKLGAFYMLCFTLIGLVELNIDNGVVEFRDIDDSKIKRLLDEYTLPAAIKPVFKPHLVTSNGIFRKSAKSTMEECPMAFEVMEKLYHRGWQINEDILTASILHFSVNTPVFVKYCQAVKPQARASKKRLCKAILDLATELYGTTFYHSYFFDFRGRIYPTTGFLHEQGIDLAKGLLLLADKKPLGEHGLKWLKHHAAACWAGATEYGVKSDKLSVIDRVKWSDANMASMLGYASDHLNNTGWMDADSPWQFLAVCFEFLALAEHESTGEDAATFCSGLVCYIDGSCNGSQHLAAMTRDEASALHVNLVANKPVQDLYKYVSAFVWTEINKLVDPNTDYDEEIDKIVDMNKKTMLLDGPDRAQHLTEMREYRTSNAGNITKLAPYYWARVTSLDMQRKLCKRGVMTLVYGVTRFGAGDQVMEDIPKHGITMLEGADASWAIWLGGIVYDTMLKVLPRSTALLTLFRTAGTRSGLSGIPLSWHTPIVNYHVVQNYATGRLVDVHTDLFEERITLRFRDNSMMYEKLSKQQAGAAPNIVHSLDATHLILTAYYSSVPVVSVHDSFGTLAGCMETLFKDVRSAFVMLYASNPLPALLEELGIDDIEVNYGEFDVMEVLNAEFCFI